MKGDETIVKRNKILVLLLAIIMVISVAGCGQSEELEQRVEINMETLSGVRGVNLGNWLVLEKWMSPSVFEGTKAEDEVSLAAALDPEVYEGRIRIHRSEYITERDFARIASLGLNAVRIPIPYYIFDDREPFIGCMEELDNAFSWAEKYGLKILIDMHMVQGSQNGFDNGGERGVCLWAQTPEEVEYVLQVLEKLAERYGKREGLLGIEPLNEPMVSDMAWADMNIMKTYPPDDKERAAASAPVSMDFLKDFYLEAYERLRAILPQEKWIVFHDGFQLGAWDDFMQGEEYTHVAFDTHQYISNYENYGIERSLEGYQSAFKQVAEQIENLAERFPVICGEWCLYNNYAYTMRDKEKKQEFYNELAEMQVEAWNSSAGYFYWNYKLLIDTVNDGTLRGYDWDAWDLDKSISQGWFPEELFQK